VTATQPEAKYESILQEDRLIDPQNRRCITLYDGLCNPWQVQQQTASESKSTDLGRHVPNQERTSFAWGRVCSCSINNYISDSYNAEETWTMQQEFVWTLRGDITSKLPTIDQPTIQVHLNMKHGITHNNVFRSMAYTPLKVVVNLKANLKPHQRQDLNKHRPFQIGTHQKTPVRRSAGRRRS